MMCRTYVFILSHLARGLLESREFRERERVSQPIICVVASICFGLYLYIIIHLHSFISSHLGVRTQRQGKAHTTSHKLFFYFITYVIIMHTICVDTSVLGRRGQYNRERQTVGS